MLASRDDDEDRDSPLLTAGSPTSTPSKADAAAPPIAPAVLSSAGFNILNGTLGPGMLVLPLALRLGALPGGDRRVVLTRREREAAVGAMRVAEPSATLPFLGVATLSLSFRDRSPSPSLLLPGGCAIPKLSGCSGCCGASVPVLSSSYTAEWLAAGGGGVCAR